MGELGGIISQFTPGAYGIWGIFLMFAAYIVREWRETRKLSADDRLARREGYAKQVESLQKENRELRKEMHADREAHTQYRQLCQDETDQLRRDIVRNEFNLQGLRRRVDTLCRDIIKVATGRDVELEIISLLNQFENEQEAQTGIVRANRVTNRDYVNYNQGRDQDKNQGHSEHRHGHDHKYE